MVLHIIRVISEGWKETDTQRPLPHGFFLLAAPPEALIYSQSFHSSVRRDDALFFFPAFLGDESFPRPRFLSNLSFLLNLGNVFFTESKPLDPILFSHRKLVKSGRSFFWPVKCPNSFLEGRLQQRNQFLRPLVSLSYPKHPLFV